MSDYMEFKGKSLDLAITEACTYFGVNREKLEIEIVSDAKSGIFGLVGVKKATVKARRMRLDPGDELAPREAKSNEREQKSLPDRRGSSERGKPRQERQEREVASERKPRQEREAASKSRIRDDADAAYSGMTVAVANIAAARPASESFASLGTDDGDDADEPTLRPRREPRLDGRQSREERQERQEKTPRRSSDKPLDRAARSREPVRDNSGSGGAVEGSTRRHQEGRDRKRTQHPAESRAESRAEGRNQGRNSRTNGVDFSQSKAESERHSPERQSGNASPSRSPRGRLSDKTSRQTLDVAAPGDNNPLIEDEVCNDGFAPLNIESVGAERVIEEATKVVLRLVESIVDNPACEVEITPDSRIKVMIDAGDSSGLLIGRYSQTLTAIQYIASRILSRVFGAAARMQIDAGDYRERQDDKMRELALNLAERVKEEGRGLYTRPLSSYHRRVVHMTLQDDPELQTRSKGDGAMKRVLITLKRR